MLSSIIKRVLLLLAVQATVQGFAPGTTTSLSSSSSTALHSTSTKKATLTDSTTWKFTLNTYGLPTKNGKRCDQLFVIESQFLEDEGYEPPQGTLRQVRTSAVENNDEEASSSNTANRLELASSRWILSEDPDEDDKWGLWIWGLFKEPLYPFLLLQMETKEMPLPGSDGDSIKPLKLYAQLVHKRDVETGAVELEGATLNVRVMETVKADPFGAASVELYDEVDVGRLSVAPL